LYNSKYAKLDVAALKKNAAFLFLVFEKTIKVMDMGEGHKQLISPFKTP
jgi:hypothetical protein